MSTPTLAEMADAYPKLDTVAMLRKLSTLAMDESLDAEVRGIRLFQFRDACTPEAVKSLLDALEEAQRDARRKGEALKWAATVIRPGSDLHNEMLASIAETQQENKTP